ncbi:aminotransferase class I/II-fold pyridoxal phosphate-dependent enzyme [Dyella sp. M7H15-1]|uniref:trans-sulfuration enzyme family protein n=1 Tax=Dyella sp. M7H15-1 TaxID=2501295 RepID=UPI00100500A3|nr:aminotransferase class I/II-fold pyridoxal phosphate-dependent enzyme [Dyella sp. M7H15-1]QAU23892.1 aminotransferase class I/II-fold pyridoxal phosphate-dependent enzyme [Dyella sp. M7H15-1]
MASSREQSLQTDIIHAGENAKREYGSIVTPIFQSSIFVNRNDGDYDGIRYIRLNNTPTHLALHEKLVRLEQGEAALAVASGMAAITSVMLGCLRSGDHVLVQESLYGGTHAFVKEDLGDYGIAFDFINIDDPGQWREVLRPNTRMIYTEAVSNPIMRVIDHRAVVAFARQYGLVSVIDATLASPVNFRPLHLGYDLVVHSATKYLNGHSDVMAGAIVGSAEHIRHIRHKVNHLGCSLNPLDCFLLHRGMRTLAVRIREQNANALRLAEYLSRHAGVRRVNYPGLSDNRYHALASSLFDGFGGVLSMDVDSERYDAGRIVAAVNLYADAVSLGSIESLITRPAFTSHSGMSVEDRRRAGIDDDLIRISVGLELADDLIVDLDQAFAAGER